MRIIDISAAEALLGSIEGIAGARIGADADGRIHEIHVLATPGLQPKQVVRNVESALRAVLDVEIDRRIVSVAQSREAEAASTEPIAAASSDGDEPVPGELTQARPEFINFETHSPPGTSTSCRVSLRMRADVFTGEGNGTNSERGRAEAAAIAVIGALAECLPHCPLELEGVKVLEHRGQRLVLVAVYGFYRRSPIPLTGAAHIRRGPEEAAVIATLQATNRWASAEP